MGKVAKCLGIGVKGSVRVVLRRESYAAGDMVQGQVVLRVSRPIECEGAFASAAGGGRLLELEN